MSDDSQPLQTIAADDYYEHCKNAIDEDMQEIEDQSKKHEYLFRILQFFVEDLKDCYKYNYQDRIDESLDLVDYVLELIKWA
jgi:hypothetical protein